MASEISKLEPELRAGGVGLVGVGPEEAGLKEFKEGEFFKGCRCLTSFCLVRCMEGVAFTIMVNTHRETLLEVFFYKLQTSIMVKCNRVLQQQTLQQNLPHMNIFLFCYFSF